MAESNRPARVRALPLSFAAWLRPGAAVIAVIALAAAVAAPPALADENDLLDFCVGNPDACAISVQAPDEGWEGHLQADRPQSLASTFKILVLLAYAQAVAGGALDPDDTVDKDEWGRYFSGGTGLAGTWNALGQPDRIRLDDLARVMILDSDNAATDLFLATIKKKLFKKSVKLFDWHDAPAQIGAMFGLWQSLNGVGGTGNRVAMDYGGFESGAYQKELSQHTKQLKKDPFVDVVRAGLCDQPPWIAGQPPCNPAQPFITEQNLRTLENHHFVRGTTRSYAALMRKLLDRRLLSASAREVVERHLDEAWLEKFPTLTPAFSRYGLKGGNLGTGAGNQILTWAHYMETAEGRFVAIVFLQDMLSTRKPPKVADVNAFAQQFALNAGFRQRVRDAIGGADLPPELAPQLKNVKAAGRTVTVKAQIWNTSPKASGGPMTVSLYVLDDTATSGATPLDSVEIGSIGGYKGKKITLKGTAGQDVGGKLAVVLVDSGEEIDEQEESNNLTWERLK